MVDRSIKLIPKPTRVTKDNIIDLLNDAISEVNKIHKLYDKFFAANDGNPSYLEAIEGKLSTITTKYAELFEETSPSKVVEAEQALDQIRAYHKELLAGTDSIKADIHDSQTEITTFYNKLFSKSDGETEDGGQQAIVEAAIKSITDFDIQLNNAATGYKFTIEGAKDEILSAHSELFNKDKSTGKSVSSQLNDEIVATHKSHVEVNDVIVPFIKDQKTEITKVAQDIKSKQAEVNSLLSDATVRTLAKGYTESMQIYGSPLIKRFPKKDVGGRFSYILFVLLSQSKYFIKFVGSYVLFIGPLLLIGALFVINNKSIFGIDLASSTVKFSGSEYVLYKLTIALPLLWVSWFGQRSISHRRRLFEEYNHKLRVVQMYMLFTAQKDTYKLTTDAMKELESELLETIARNPSQVYGKDETMIDKMIDIFVSKKDKNEV